MSIFFFLPVRTRCLDSVKTASVPRSRSDLAQVFGDGAGIGQDSGTARGPLSPEAAVQGHLSKVNVTAHGQPLLGIAVEP